MCDRIEIQDLDTTRQKTFCQVAPKHYLRGLKYREDGEDYSDDIRIDCLGAWNRRSFCSSASYNPVSPAGSHTVP